MASDRLRIYDAHDPDESPDPGRPSVAYLRCGPIAVRAGLEVWTAEEWVRIPPGRRPPEDRVLRMRNGGRVLVSPYDPRTHGA